MNKYLKNKNPKEHISLKVQNSNLKVNSNDNKSITALINHKDRYNEEKSSLYKEERDRVLSYTTKDSTPRVEVTVEFAAKQLFQILLIDIKRSSVQFDELIPGAICV
jgi:hypothetical protein